MIAKLRPLGVRAGGYTLIELIFVIALLGLAATLLVPHLVQQDSMTVQAAVRRFIADLSFAQSDALAHQEFRRVHFYEDGRGYCIVRVTEADFNLPFDAVTADYINDPLRGARGFLGEAGRWRPYIIDFTTEERFQGVSITSGSIDGVLLTPTGTDITYDQLGGTVMTGNLPGTGGQIVLSFDTASYRITIAAFTGKLTVLKLS